MLLFHFLHIISDVKKYKKFTSKVKTKYLIREINGTD